MPGLRDVSDQVLPLLVDRFLTKAKDTPEVGGNACSTAHNMYIFVMICVHIMFIRIYAYIYKCVCVCCEFVIEYIPRPSNDTFICVSI